MLSLVVPLLPFAALLSSAMQPLPQVVAGGACRWRTSARVHTPAMSMNDDESNFSDLDMAALHKRIATAKIKHLVVKDDDIIMNSPNEVYVLLFNLDNTGEEGIYTLQGRTGTFVLAFEETEGASTFADMLTADGFVGATPQRWDKHQLNSFCEAGAFQVSLVPQGTPIAAPATNEFQHGICYLP